MVNTIRLKKMNDKFSNFGRVFIVQIRAEEGSFAITIFEQS